MPKKVYKKKTPMRKRVYKKARIQKIVVFKASHQQPIPPSLSDKFNMIWQGQIKVRAGNANMVLSVHANNLVTGNNQGPTQCGAAGTNWSNVALFLATPPLSATFVDYPTGFTSFVSPGISASSLYSRYFVTGVSYEFTVQPISTADAIKFAVFPDMPGNVATLSTNYVNIREAENGPFAQSKICYSSNDSRGNTIKGYLDIAKYLGMSKSDMLKDHSYSGLVNAVSNKTTDLNNLVTLNTQFTTLDGVDTASAINVSVKLRYYVTFQTAQGKLLTD